VKRGVGVSPKHLKCPKQARQHHPLTKFAASLQVFYGSWDNFYGITAFRNAPLLADNRRYRPTQLDQEDDNPMTTQIEDELHDVYKRLQARANSRGLIQTSQQALANQFGLPHIRFHRLLHRLIDNGLVKMSGGGRQPKTLLIVGPSTKREPAPCEQLSMAL